MAGGDEWNDALPSQIEAFFYDVARRSEGVWGGAPHSARSLRDGFAEHWGLRAEDIPLLEFDRSNFESPFALVVDL